MISRIIGGSLLIVGTSIGAGMLGLPVVTAAGGFYHSFWLFIGAWIFTVIGAFFILEVNLWLPENTNLISMARITLGKTGQVFTWITYLLLLYTLIAAYIAGGGDLLHRLFYLVNVDFPRWLDATLFLIIFGSAIYFGIAVVDWTNRGLMIIKMSAYILLIALVMPHVNIKLLRGGHFYLLAPAVMVVITAFGYASIIPSLRYYLNSNVNALRITILLGSLISLFCYLLWNMVVQGTVQSGGAKGLIHITISGQVASRLTMALSEHARNEYIRNLARLFTSICVTTSFLGVALCLSDFITDGLKIPKTLSGRWLNMLVTFAPPLAVVIIKPGIFILGLNLAGIFCVLLLMLLPALMAWSGRYIKRTASGYQLWGGRTLVLLQIIVSVGLLVFGVM